MWFFQKCFFQREGEALCCRNLQLYHKSHEFWKFHWNFSSRSKDISIFLFKFSYVHQFFFLTFPCYKETDDVTIFCHEPVSSSWNMKRGSNWHPLLEKITFKKPNLIRVKSYRCLKQAIHQICRKWTAVSFSKFYGFWLNTEKHFFTLKSAETV